MLSASSHGMQLCDVSTSYLIQKISYKDHSSASYCFRFNPDGSLDLRRWIHVSSVLRLKLRAPVVWVTMVATTLFAVWSVDV